jgi:hypothetical protein
LQFQHIYRKYECGFLLFSLASPGKSRDSAFIFSATTSCQTITYLPPVSIDFRHISRSIFSAFETGLLNYEPVILRSDKASLNKLAYTHFDK